MSRFLHILIKHLQELKILSQNISKRNDVNTMMSVDTIDAVIITNEYRSSPTYSCRFTHHQDKNTITIRYVSDIHNDTTTFDLNDPTSIKQIEQSMRFNIRHSSWGHYAR